MSRRCYGAWVQNSTVLWETLAAVTMDRAVRLHHGCLRRLLRPFNGYESATGGNRTAERQRTVGDAGSCR